MTGRETHVRRLAEHLGEPLDAACPIGRPGGAARGVVSDVQVGNYAWLGLGPDGLVVTRTSLLGRPAGEPLARVAYADVADVTLTETKFTLRVGLDLRDGRRMVFETKRHGQNRPSVDVMELLRRRCTDPDERLEASP